MQPALSALPLCSRPTVALGDDTTTTKDEVTSTANVRAKHSNLKPGNGAYRGSNVLYCTRTGAVRACFSYTSKSMIDNLLRFPGIKKGWECGYGNLSNDWRMGLCSFSATARLMLVGREGSYNHIMPTPRLMRASYNCLSKLWQQLLPCKNCTVSYLLLTTPQMIERVQWRYVVVALEHCV